MKFWISFLAVLAIAVVVVDAGGEHIGQSHSVRHARLAHRRAEGTSIRKRCQARSTNKSSGNPPQASPSPAAKTNNAAASPTSKSSSGSGLAPAVNGLISVKSNCGDIGATKDITAVSGPNGNIGWLNCGIDDGGWRPPYVQVSQIITVDLANAVKDPQTPFSACKDYVSMFEKYAKQYNVPPILMAAFAMQESSCNPNTVGGAGEQGLMQITKDKCGGAPNGNCKDPDFNIRTGTKFFSDTLKGNNGDLLKSIGNWNGWFEGMTIGQATAAGDTSCCRCQNNLDYLHQFLNGWCMNINAYDYVPRLGKFFNLDKCGS